MKSYPSSTLYIKMQNIYLEVCFQHLYPFNVASWARPLPKYLTREQFDILHLNWNDKENVSTWFTHLKYIHI